jgi:hypothetical protein
MTEFVPATAAAVREYYGKMPDLTLRMAYFVMDGDAPISLGGFIRVRHDVVALFSDTKPGAQKAHPVTALKFGKFLMGIADEKHWTVISWPDENLDVAEKFLRHLGFEPTDGKEWVRWAR